MREPRSPSLRLRRLATELRRARERAGYKVTQVAKELGWSAPKVSKMETTETKRISAADLDKLMKLYKIEDAETREAMHALARDARERGWWAKYKGLFGDRALADFEAEASTIRTFEALCIPGLLQTPEYARALFEGGRYTSEEEIERRVEYRMARREILTRFSPARLRAVLDEAALRRTIGGPRIMREQLEHLLYMAQMPNIDVQVVPFTAGSHAGLTAPFMILEFPEPLDTPIVWVGTMAGSVFFEQPEEIERYNVTFGDLQGSALSTKQSAEFIKDVAASLRE
ncbi:helix-turn-helix domain-containing protein [Thermobifida alba]|uniref:Helix-turn-helix domain-containing protein n=1 Tax=Thermobifida alba TaxID=53522 RepID=A0ABY4KZU7_THEAE|nr:helix-turn-helix transcriptional regulator [Thermobifida alba]UPT20947.1 helix-turn-helix domain-containing protein [Thermobifida alba]